MSTANTRPDPAPPPDAEMAAARAARQALAAQQLRHAAGRWPTSVQITILGQQLVRSIDRYERLHRQPPTWADVFAGVDPSLLTRCKRRRTAGHTSRRTGDGNCGNT